MPYVMTLICRVDGKLVGKYLKSFNASYVLPSGRYDGGMLEITSNIEEAQKFDNPTEVLNKWKETAPKPFNVRPWDGKPNRPLTAFTIEVEKI